MAERIKVTQKDIINQANDMLVAKYRLEIQDIQRQIRGLALTETEVRLLGAWFKGNGHFSVEKFVGHDPIMFREISRWDQTGTSAEAPTFQCTLSLTLDQMPAWFRERQATVLSLSKRQWALEQQADAVRTKERVAVLEHVMQESEEGRQIAALLKKMVAEVSI